MAACVHSSHSGKTRETLPLGKENCAASRKTKQAIASNSRQGAVATKTARSGRGCPSTCSRNIGERRCHPSRRAPVPYDVNGDAANNGKIVDRCQSELPRVNPAARRCSNGSRCSTPQKTCLSQVGQQIVGNASFSPHARGTETKSKDRVFDLVNQLLSPKVQVQESATIADVPCKLHPQEVAKVFIDNVPGVEGFLFRQQPGMFCLEFLQSAYHSGFTAFRSTPMHDHLVRLFRSIVHHGLENGPSAPRYLREVAEAFMDCQAVQARVVERIGLQIQGVSSDFRGLLIALTCEYKTVAIKMLAAERISQLQVSDDGNPVHYENRLIADIGPALGLDASDIRRARLDEHARSRFQCLNHVEQEKATKRCRQLFDLDALLGALAGEVNSFSAESPQNSLPWLFMDWVSRRFDQKHIVFDDTCMHVEVGRPLLLAVLEDLFMGKVRSGKDEVYRGVLLRDVFFPCLP